MDEKKWYEKCKSLGIIIAITGILYVISEWIFRVPEERYVNGGLQVVMVVTLVLFLVHIFIMSTKEKITSFEMVMLLLPLILVSSVLVNMVLSDGHRNINMETSLVTTFLVGIPAIIFIAWYLLILKKDSIHKEKTNL